MAREHILHRIRTALGRSAGAPAADPPPVRLRIPEVEIEQRIATMRMRIEALAGKTARTDDPRAYVAEAIAGKEPRGLDLNNVPRCTYCEPQVASLGLTEAQAKETGREIRIGKFPFRANGKALGINEYDGFVKLVVDKKYGEILGVHMIGPEVTDLTGELSLAKSMELTPMEIGHAIHAHPTLTEAVGEAALDALGEAIHI